jgi:phosphatidylinositol alpha-1,6-mannosyltransferase
MILIFTFDFLPQRGGIHTYSYELAKNLRDLGIDIMVITPASDGDLLFDKKQKYVVMFFYLVHVLKKCEINRIYATNWIPGGFLAFFASKLFKVPYFIAAHSSELSFRNPIFRRAMTLTFKNAEKIFAVSNYTSQKILDLGISREKVAIIPNGVDIQRFKTGVNTLEVIKKHELKGKKVILTVSRLVRKKGHDMVIRALPEVLKIAKDAVYLIVGEGPEEERLKGLMRDLNLEEHVIFAGNMSDDALPKYYNACDVFIMPSREIRGDVEGFPVVYMEAGACAKPVIGGKSGGVEDAIIDGVTGLLVNPLNVKEVADALIRLLTDKNIAKRLGENGRRRAEGLTWNEIAKRILQNMNSRT